MINYWVRPAIQIRFFMHALSICTLAIGMGVSFAVLRMASDDSSAQASYADQSEVLRKTIYVMGGSMVVLGLIALIITVVFVHRVVGPMVPIERMVDALCEGHFSARVTLRKKDEFQTLAAKLNKMAESIEASRRLATPQAASKSGAS